MGMSSSKQSPGPEGGELPSGVVGSREGEKPAKGSEKEAEGHVHMPTDTATRMLTVWPQGLMF